MAIPDIQIPLKQKICRFRNFKHVLHKANVTPKKKYRSTSTSQSNGKSRCERTLVRKTRTTNSIKRMSWMFCRDKNTLLYLSSHIKNTAHLQQTFVDTRTDYNIGHLLIKLMLNL